MKAICGIELVVDGFSWLSMVINGCWWFLLMVVVGCLFCYWLSLVV